MDDPVIWRSSWRRVVCTCGLRWCGIFPVDRLRGAFCCPVCGRHTPVDSLPPCDHKHGAIGPALPTSCLP